MATMAMCPDCEVLISIPGALRLGKIVECPECGATLEVVSLDPPELDLVEEDEEWEEDLDELDEDYLWEEEEEEEEDLEEDFDDEI